MNLFDFISQLESSSNQYAVRFEPAYSPNSAHVYPMMELCGCNYTTAKILCAMSWGSVQIMGDELIALGLAVSPFAYLQDNTMQADFFNRYCAADHLGYTLDDILNDSNKRRIFARLYNGPGNVDGYMLRIAQVAKSLNLQVQP